MLCGSCGYDNLDDARYCAICGNGFAEVAGEAHVDVGTLPCPSCGFLNEEIAVYCRSCGKKMKKRTRRKAEAKPVPTAPSPEAVEVEALSLEPSVQEAELAVLFGLESPEAGEAVPTAQADVENEAEPEPADEPTVLSPPDDDRAITNPEEMARLTALIESEAPAPTEEVAAEPTSDEPVEPIGEPPEAIVETPVPEPEATAPSDDGGSITDPDEMAKLIASLKSEEAALPEPIEAAELPEEVAETPVPEAATPPDGGGAITDPDEMAKLIASIKSEEETLPEPIEVTELPEEVPETPVLETEAATPPDDGGAITDPDEMAKLIASIKSEEPVLHEPAEQTEQVDQIVEPVAVADEGPETEVPADTDEFSKYVSTPHESVEAVLVDESEDAVSESDDDAEAATIAAMAEVTSTLNSLIKDLLDVEIEEGDRADIVDAPSSVFPPPDPGQDVEEPAAPANVRRLPSLPKLPIGSWFRDAVGYFVLVAAFLLSGLSIGLWVWYLFVS